MSVVQKCVICGRELDMNLTQLVLVTKLGGVESACCCHEGSTQLKTYVESHGGAITFDEYYKSQKEGRKYNV